jgi:hypothetical protein
MFDTAADVAPNAMKPWSEMRPDQGFCGGGGWI